MMRNTDSGMMEQRNREGTLIHSKAMTAGIHIVISFIISLPLKKKKS